MFQFDHVRTRFAPSPTGYMHVGNLRTALFAYLVAKSNNGRFLLRIEDTDQERQVEGAVEIIYKTLKETGLQWDEGPDIGGPVGPYIQSQRMGMFKKYAEQLVESGHAYYCFCDKERLDEVRKVQEASGMAPRYDGHCRNLSKEEVAEKLAAGIPYVIRQKVPTEGTVTFHDEVYGDVTVECSTLDDQILIKGDGMPTYNFANVVDDHTMGITHVIRGNEYLSSAPKYNLLYEAFGWEIPKYIHCAPVMRDATHKLSKRHGDASYEDLVQMGFLTPAILNYIALLGWSPKGDQEIFSLEELVKIFDISGITKSPAIFDMQKLRYINGEYIRKLSPEEFYEKALPWIRRTVKSETADLRELCTVLQTRCESLGDIPEQVDFIDALPDYDIELYTSKKMKTTPETAREALTAVLPILESLPEWNAEAIHAALFAEIEKLGVKNGWLLYPLRVAVSGKQFTPGGGIELAVVLGKAARDVKAADAADYIFGYTVLNDVSARDLQTGHKQWYFGKSLDGFTPIGPCIVTADEFDSYPPQLGIRSFVNGEKRQDSNTGLQIFDIDHVIAELSQGMTLKAGTIIATGTPAGVGMGMEPPCFLKPGDEVCCEIEGIGTLTNTVR